MKQYFALVLFLFVSITGIHAQSVTGEWFGIGNVNRAGENNSYLYELTLKQTGNKVTGELVYYLRNLTTTIKVAGTFDAKKRLLELKPRPILNFLAKDVNGADCPMEGSFTLRTSRVESILIGQFNPTYEYRNTCPAVNIKFRKEVPGIDSTVAKRRNTSEPVVLDLPLEKIAKKDAAPTVKPDTISPIIAALKLRVFETAPVIEVESDSLKVTLYDNGEVDNDTISLFYNRVLVAQKQMLSDKPLTFMLPVDTAINEIAMYAENLGSIPPNTAVAIIYAGEKRFELFLTSTFIKNATIRFRKKSPGANPQ